MDGYIDAELDFVVRRHIRRVAEDFANCCHPRHRRNETSGEGHSAPEENPLSSDSNSIR